MESFSQSYKEAGVDVTAGYESVELMKEHVKRTHIKGVMSAIGGFGGLFQPDFTSMKEPVLVSGTDGVGTKLKIAFLMDKHDTIGIDCVAMCANDVICVGAKPLFFLDYLACGKNKPKKIASIVAGVAEGCVQAGCALIGGETAEMPGFYPVDEYDLAGFCVGMGDKSKLIDSSNVRVGNVLIALPSSGVHSNGFSLVRRVFNVKPENIDLYIDELGKTLGEELLTPTRIYVNSILTVVEKYRINGVSHITGGGFYENIPRMLSKRQRAVINKSVLDIPPIFNVLSKTGNIPERDMFNTFNMGVGMILAVSPSDADGIVSLLKETGEKAYILGEVKSGEPGVDII